jgi:uncharacterized membrane protein YvbJ
VNCPACHHDNPERAKFCLECGTPVMARGPQAAEGGALRGEAERSKPDSSRKIVSILFADLRSRASTS